MGNQIDFLGSIYGYGTGFAGCVFNTEGLCPTINTSYFKNGERNTCENLTSGNGYEGIMEIEKQKINTNGTEYAQCLLAQNFGSETDLIKNATRYFNKDYSIQGGCQGVFEVDKMCVAMRGRVQGDGQICPTLTTQEPEIYYIELAPPDEYTSAFTDGENIFFIRLRKLTPRECWRLMGFPDEAFDKASQVNSNTQLYKQAGNSIVVNVLMAIFEQMNLMEV